MRANAPRMHIAGLFILLFLSTHPLQAEEPEPYKGRIKSETEHFLFIYEAKDREEVKVLLGFAEQVYDKVADFYGSYPKKIYCVVNGRENEYSNFFHPFPAHISITVSPPTWPVFGPRLDEWLRLVFTHELTHNIQIPYESGIMKTLSYVFGPGAKSVPGGFQQSWAQEGPAVLVETMFTNGGRGENPFFEMYYRALILEEDFFSYRKAGSTSVFGPPSRPYIAGYLLASHIYENYGAEALKKIQERHSSFPFGGPDPSLKAVTGKTGKELFDEMVLILKERYSEFESIPPGQRVSPPGSYYLPRVTDRGWILYRTTLNSPPAVVLFQPVSGKEEVLAIASLTDKSSFTADKTGNTVVFSKNVNEVHVAGEADYSDLFVLRGGRGKLERLTENSHLWHPALSPDGKNLIAVRGLGSDSCLVAVDPVSGNESLIFSRPNTSVFNPVFSETGDSIFFSINDSGRQDIWSLPFPAPANHFDLQESPRSFNEDLAVVMTGPDTHAEYFPVVSGDSLVYSSDRTGSLALYRQKLDGTALPLMIAEDPVGAYAGFVDRDTVYYATYTSTGFALKTKPLPEPAAPVEDQKEPVLHKTPGSDDPPSVGVESRYYDLPRFMYWLPLPVYYDPYDPTSLKIGAGAYIQSRSILGGTHLDATITIDPDSLQPGAEIRAGLTTGSGSLSFGVFQGYHAVGANAYAQDTQARVSFLQPLVSTFSYPFTNRLSAHISGAYSIRLINPEPFGFHEMLTADSNVSSFRFGADLLYLYGRSGGVKDLFAPVQLNLRLGVTALLPVLPPSSPDFSFHVETNIQFPFFFKHQVFGLGLNSVITPWSESSRSPVSRAGFYSNLTFSNASALMGIDYRFHIALMDIPLPYGFSIDHLGGGIYLESTASWFSSSLISPVKFSPYLMPGVELILSVGSVSHISVGAGLGFRINTLAPEQFSVKTDIRPYVFMGTGGFSNGYSPANKISAPVLESK